MYRRRLAAVLSVAVISVAAIGCGDDTVSPVDTGAGNDAGDEPSNPDDPSDPSDPSDPTG